MNVSDIQLRVKRQFGDESGVQVTNQDIIRWINDAVNHLVKINEGLLEKVTTTDLVEGQDEYDLPADTLIFRGLHIKSKDYNSYYKMKGYSFTEFNEYIDGWDGTTYNDATPIVFTIYAGKLILFPTPDHGNTDGLKIYYNRRPVGVSSDTDEPDLPESYHESIVKYALKLAYEMDENFEGASAKSQEVDSDLTYLRGRDDWKQQDTYSTITVLEEDAWA